MAAEKHTCFVAGRQLGSAFPPTPPAHVSARAREGGRLPAMAAALPHLNLALVGLERAGKSSLGGCIAASTGAVSAKALKRIEARAAEAGRPLAKYAWVLDTTPAEREGGTIQINIHGAETAHRRWSLIDTPGRANLAKNALTGISQARASSPPRSYPPCPCCSPPLHGYDDSSTFAVSTEAQKSLWVWGVRWSISHGPPHCPRHFVR